MLAEPPILSVITVVYNDKKNIERTMLSVLQQSYPHIEYIIVDGASTDGTLEIINSYKEKISVFISEPDKGIYDAMNKAMKLTTGKYLIFMNSGDVFYETETVEKVFATADDADIYYGETEMVNEQLQSLGRRRHKAPEVFTLNSFKYGMSISHQAIYVKRNLAEPYDSKYKLSADIDWILKIVKKSNSIVNTHLYVAKYLVGGMSKKRHLQSLKERYEIFKNYYGLIPNLLNHVIIAFRLGFYWILNRRTND